MPLPRLEHDPREGLDHQDAPEIEWVPSLGCWCVFGKDAIATVVKSANFAAADFAEIHRTLERKVNIDFSALVRIFEHSPNANEGARHAELRKDLARLLASNMAETKQQTAGVMHGIIGKTCYAGAQVDLVQDVIEPICDALFAFVLGVERPPNCKSGVSPSQIFDLYLGLNRRREINEKAGEMLDHFAGAREKLRTTPDYAVALSMVGYDSIVGSIACSLLDSLQRNEGRKLSDMAFPQQFSVTGVPYIERFAANDCMLAGAEIKAADRVRLYLEAGYDCGSSLFRQGASFLHRRGCFDLALADLDGRTRAFAACLRG
jgi:cytochrome P450